MNRVAKKTEKDSYIDKIHKEVYSGKHAFTHIISFYSHHFMKQTFLSPFYK